MCYTAGSNNRSEADLNVFFSLMWRVVVQAAMHVLPCRSGCVLFQRDLKNSIETLHGGLAQYNLVFLWSACYMNCRMLRGSWFKRRKLFLGSFVSFTLFMSIVFILNHMLWSTGIYVLVIMADVTSLFILKMVKHMRNNCWDFIFCIFNKSEII